MILSSGRSLGPVPTRSISGQSRVDLGSVSGQSRVDLGSVSGQSRVDLGSISGRSRGQSRGASRGQSRGASRVRTWCETFITRELNECASDWAEMRKEPGTREISSEPTGESDSEPSHQPTTPASYLELISSSPVSWQPSPGGGGGEGGVSAGGPPSPRPPLPSLSSPPPPLPSPPQAAPASVWLSTERAAAAACRRRAWTCRGHGFASEPAAASLLVRV